MDFRRQPPETPDGRYPAQISGAKRYHEYLNRERQKEIYQKTAERKMPNDKMTLQDAETKGSLPIQDLDKPLDDKDNLYLTAEKEKAKADKKAAAIRKTVVFVLCFVLSFLLSITSVRIPLTPSTVRIDFSTFGALSAALCLHPVAGIAVIILKNTIYLLFTANIPNIVNKTILDLLFVVLLYFIFVRTLNSKFVRNKVESDSQSDRSIRDYATVCILFAGAVSSLIAGLASVLTTEHILLPLVYRFYRNEGIMYHDILISYQNAFDSLTRHIPFVKKMIPSMDNLKTGLLLYNFPLNVFKFFVCTFASAFIYPLLSSFAKRD